VRIFLGGTSQSRLVKSGSSYLSQSELPVTFGVGRRDRVERVVLQWPSGRTEEFANIATGQAYDCTEGQGIVPVRRWCPRPLTCSRYCSLAAVEVKKLPMTWIKTIPMAQALETTGPLRDAYLAVMPTYPAEYSQPNAIPEVAADSIVASHSLIPAALEHAFATFGSLMAEDLPLTRRQHEMIATLVSVKNRCFYWVESHAEFLRKVTLDAALVDAIRRDYRTAALDRADLAMLDYVAKVTTDATLVARDDHACLREAGFDDRGILQITLIAAWFNYVNRVADALGVGRP
jgi:uncharacterized peroxidase-related enzyme